MAVGLVGAVASAVSLLGYGPLARLTHGRGHPDPGGHRVAAITAFAPRAPPSMATGVQVSVHGYRWDPQTCDGAAPWLGQRTHRSNLPRAEKRSSVESGRPDAAAEVEAGRAPAAVIRAGAGRWDFDVSADPATTPSHDC